MEMKFSIFKANIKKAYPKIIAELEKRGETDDSEIKLKYYPDFEDNMRDPEKYIYFLYDYNNPDPNKRYFFRVDNYWCSYEFVSDLFKSEIRNKGTIWAQPIRTKTVDMAKKYRREMAEVQGYTATIPLFSKKETMEVEAEEAKKEPPKDAVSIKLPYFEFKKYISSYPDTIKAIEKQIGKNARTEGYEISLKYKPYYDYDYFCYRYGRNFRNKIHIYIKSGVDGKYSTYLKDTYYDPVRNPEGDISIKSGSQADLLSSRGSNSVKVGQTVAAKKLEDQENASNMIAKRDTVKPNRLVQGWQGQ
jgi:hypothetical protein